MAVRAKRRPHNRAKWRPLTVPVGSRAILAMQKVEGSSPFIRFARFRKYLEDRIFCPRRSYGSGLFSRIFSRFNLLRASDGLDRLPRDHCASAVSRAANWRTGLVWVNCFFERDLRLPFGGEKSSGIGREGGVHSREFFTEPRAIVIRLTR